MTVKAIPSSSTVVVALMEAISYLDDTIDQPHKCPVCDRLHSLGNKELRDAVKLRSTLTFALNWFFAE